MADLTGTMFGNYRVEQLMGRGAIAEVYRAYDVRSRQQVALKLIYPDLSAQENFRKRFIREMQTVFQLNHPYIVKVYDTDFMEQRLYVAMEYLTGGSLQSYIAFHAREQRLPRLIEVVQYLWQVAEALHYAHDQRVLHLELKPDNILLRRVDNRGQFQAVVTDLGFRQASQGKPGSQFMPPVGTLPYMSPELCAGLQVDVTSDIYSTGIILYYLSVGQLPFIPHTLNEAIEMHGRTPVPRPREVRRSLIPELDTIIMQCLEKNPANRYQTAAALARDLEKLFQLLQGRYSTLLNPRQEFPPTTPFYETVPEPRVSYTGIRQSPDVAATDQLVITGPGIQTRAQPLNQGILVLGRDPGSDIVLDSDLISRFHARLERLTDLTYQVVDLGSTNGTWLDAVQLAPNRPLRWQPGAILRLGEFRLYIQSAVGMMLTAPGAQLQPTFEGRAAGLSQLPSQPLEAPAPTLDVALEINPIKVIVVPGERQNLKVTITNQTEREDYFYARVQGLETGWYSVLEADNDVAGSGGVGSINLILHPPRNSASTAGLYGFEIQVFSQVQPEALPASITAQLQIEPFYGMTVDAHPRQLRAGGEIRCRVVNSGNTLRTCTISAVDREDGLNLRYNADSITIPPGEQQEIPILVSPKERALVSLTERYSFDVVLKEDRAEIEPQIQRVQVIVPPVFTPWLLSVIAAFFLICGVVTLFTITQVVSFNTQRVQTQQANATNEAVKAATETALSDADQDGLTLMEEKLLGTDPENPDTDGDGLPDFREARQLGTNPKSQDSDNDLLSDFVEVNGCTSPNNPDTDGDGVRDNLDPDTCR